jgi:hypothetical protein
MARAYEVHVYLATAVAKTAPGLIKGERYAVLIFCRGPEGKPAQERAARLCASQAGWTSIEIERSRRLPAQARPAEPTLRAAFEEALREGGSVVAHRRREGR